MRLRLAEVDVKMTAEAPGTSLEEVLGVFEVFASGSLTDEVYVLEDVSGKRIAIAPKEFKARWARPRGA